MMMLGNVRVLALWRVLVVMWLCLLAVGLALSVAFCGE